MSVMFFMDESGQDRGDSPYEVLAGIAIEDDCLWNLVCDIHELEMQFFGTRYSADENELKAKKLLKRKTFKHAEQLPPIEDKAQRAIWARNCLLDGANAKRHEITALAQAKIDYAKNVLLLCNKYRCKVFAAIINDYTKINNDAEMLRKDYVYLFERFYYYLQYKKDETGIIVFDELEKSQCHMLVKQITNYYKKSAKGKLRSNLLIPEPFFVHSDLTTGIQIADLVAYITSWSFRIGALDKNMRDELTDFVDIIKSMRFREMVTQDDDTQRECWSVFYI